MSNPLLRRPETLNTATSGISIGGAPSPSASGTPRPFGGKSLQRKRPVGLSIDKAIESSRANPQIPLDGSNSASAFGLTEAEKLRKDIEKLQLSSRSSGSERSDSPLTSPTQPLTPTSITQSDSSSGTGTGKKKKDKGEKDKKKKIDKDGADLVKDEDLEVLRDLGEGNGGTVTKVWNKKRGCVMARKLILVDAKPSVRKQILRELQIMNQCDSPYIVGYYGCFPVDVHVGVVMECMDAGSLNDIYRRNGAIPVQIVGKVAEAVLKGLIYLYDTHRIIHRDIKPSNILANTAGQIKICDFGVSGELINSIANTFVGTSTYMSPERIQGAAYTIKSDVWSLGISLIEIATARFPFRDSDRSSDEDEEDGFVGEYDPDPTLPISSNRPDLSELQSRNRKLRKTKGVSLGGGGHTMSILDLMQHIVNEPAPRLEGKRRSFPQEAKDFVEGCLTKDPGERRSPQDLLKSTWITQSGITQDDVQRWAQGLELDA